MDVTYEFSRQGVVREMVDSTCEDVYVLVALEEEKDGERVARLKATIAREGSPETDIPPAVRHVIVPWKQWGSARRCLNMARVRPDWDRAVKTVEELTSRG